MAGELGNTLERYVRDPSVRVLILRLRQAQDTDITTASVLLSTSQKLASQGRTLILLGLRSSTLTLFERTGIAEKIGRENIFPAQAGWFTAMELALRRALALIGTHACGDPCPLAEYVAAQEHLRASFGASQQEQSET